MVPLLRLLRDCVMTSLFRVSRKGLGKTTGAIAMCQVVSANASGLTGTANAAFVLIQIYPMHLRWFPNEWCHDLLVSFPFEGPALSAQRSAANLLGIQTSIEQRELYIEYRHVSQSS
jgi:hypothetical protein